MFMKPKYILIGGDVLSHAMSERAVHEGTAPFRDWSTWYRVTGDLGAEKAPLVVLHGGPGCTHHYVLALAALADSGRAVVHYDQLGGGASTHLPEKGADFWTVELFLEDRVLPIHRLFAIEDGHLCASDAAPGTAAALLAGDARAWTAALGPAHDASGLRCGGERPLARQLLDALSG